MPDKPPKQRTWGGRFSGRPSDLMTRINASIAFDKLLWREDIAASKAHAAMLRDQGIVAESDAAAILEGLDRIAAEYERDGVPERIELEVLLLRRGDQPRIPHRLIVRRAHRLHSLGGHIGRHHRRPAALDRR